MKQKFLKIGSYLMVMAATMFVGFSTTSCKTDPVDPELDVKPASFTDVVAEGQSDINLEITSNTKWTISVDKDWVQFTEKTGENNKTVPFNVIANEGAERTATITVKTDDGKLTQTRTIKQLSGEVLEVPEAAGEIQGPSSGQGSVTLTVGAVTGATSYQWYKDAAAISGATSISYIATASGDYQVAGVNGAGEGPKSPVKTVTIEEIPVPDDAPEIQGDSEGETQVVLTVADIPNAATYAWYVDGTKINGATTTTYTATKSGKYQVAGVNSVGVEGAKSPEKIVTIEKGASIDDLVGEWTVSGWFMQYDSDNEEWIVANNAHTVTITKVNETTLEASNIFAFNEMYGKDIFDPESETVTLTYNSDGTINMPRQEILPTIDPDDWRTYLCRFLNEQHADNWEEGFDNVPVTNNTIDWSEGGFEFGTLESGEVLYGSYIVLTRETPNASKTYYNEGYFMNSVWTKNTGTSASAPKAKETMRLKKEDFGKGKFAF